jgi:hypothetical protein
MKSRLLSVLLFAVTCQPAHAQDINLDCEAFAAQMIERLSAEGLLAPEAADGQRARAIGMEMCNGAEASAQQQHEVGKQEALDHWFWEERADKPGNRRLRNLKR